MTFAFRSRPAEGFTYVELLMGLVIAALLFVPAYQFASLVLRRVDRMAPSGDEIEAALDVFARDIRCAAEEPKEMPFYFHLGELVLARACPSGSERVEYEPATDAGAFRRNGVALCDGVTAWKAHFFDGDNWKDDWGWNSEQDRPSEGTTGVPLAVEIEMRAAGGDVHRRVVPVMTAVIRRWAP